MRPILSNDQIHANIAGKIGGNQALVKEVQAAIEQHKVVVVGMKQNPVCKAVRKLLNEHQIEFHYLEYGSYFSMWRPRLAIKMWTGFQTFPQVFIDGVLIGGLSDVKALLEQGDFGQLLETD